MCKEMNLNHFVLKNSWSLEVWGLLMYFVLKMLFTYMQGNGYWRLS